MNWSVGMKTRFFCFPALAMALLMFPGCDYAAPPVPKLDKLEQILGVSFPDDCKVIAGTEPSESPPAGSSSLYLIVSSEPLPLPVQDRPKTRQRSRSAKRPDGTPFPISALLNLMAASGVGEEDSPEFVGDHGSAHVGRIESGQFCYREASTTTGWLTAVETHLD